MSLGAKIAVGIDVSQTRIALALIRKDGNNVRLIKSVAGPVPADAIQDGRIKNAPALAKAIGRLKGRLTKQTMPAAMSLFTAPTIMQVMEIPSQVPDNVAIFLEQEVKHFAALLGKKIALDFCAVSPVSSGSSVPGRVLTVATDAQKVDELVEMLGRAGIVVDAIEPALLGCIRPLYARTIEGKFDSNVIVGLLRDNCLTLCVFRKQKMDFVRARQLTEEKTQVPRLTDWVAAQLNAVIQSYEADAQSARGPWEVTLAADGEQLPDDAPETIKAAVIRADIQLLNPDDLSQTAVVKQARALFGFRRTEKPSLAAVGLAMRLLDMNPGNLSVNLVPAKAVRRKATRTRTLIAANVAAVIVLLMLLATSSLTWKVDALAETTTTKKERLFERANSLKEKRNLLEQRENALTAKLEHLDKTLDSGLQTYWPAVLSDIALNRPKTVCVVSVSSRTAAQMSVKGLAVSNEDVYLFVNRLNQSQSIDSAFIFETKKDGNSNGLVNFEIRCTLRGTPAAKEGT